MKRWCISLVVLFLLIPLSSSYALKAEAATNVVIQLNGVKQDYSNKAIIESGSTLVPLRAIFEALNAEVVWNNNDQSIDVKKGTTSIWLKIGSTLTKINGKDHYVTVAPKIVNGNTLVPLRFVSEALGATVTWNQASLTVDILLNNDMHVHFLDVGQGDSTFIMAPNGKTMLIDAGTAEQGERVVAYLKALGVKKIDYIVATTHPDADHIGGLVAVIDAFEVDTFINSGKVHTTNTYEQLLEAILNSEIKYVEPKKKDLIPLDDALVLQVLAINPYASENNDASIVLKLVHAQQSFLFMADASSEIEKELMEQYDVSATVLKAGHHGSRTSSSIQFLREVQPEAVLLSYGEANSYSHPHQIVVDNIRKVGAKSYATAELGSILMISDGKTLTVNKGLDIKNSTPVENKPKPTTPNVDTGMYVIPNAPTSFNNCTELRKYYPKGVKVGHPAYAVKHDRDKDGWACE